TSTPPPVNQGPGGPTGPTGPITPTAEDLTNAAAAQVNAAFNSDTGELVIKWTDTFGSEAGYRVERKSDSGTWEIEESLDATSGTGTARTWQTVIDRFVTYRVVSRMSDYVVPLKTAAGNSDVSVQGTPGTLSLEIDPGFNNLQ